MNVAQKESTTLPRVKLKLCVEVGLDFFVVLKKMTLT